MTDIVCPQCGNVIEGWADDLVVVSRRALLDEVPCECGPAYAERGLIAPACRHHDVVDVLANAAPLTVPAAAPTGGDTP